MKMIEVLQKVANGEIKDGTKLEFDGFEYEFSEDHFEDGFGNWLEDVHEISASFFNYEVELIEPKEKKYLVKFNMRGLQERFTYLNYCETSKRVNLHDKYRLSSIQTEFTKDELQSIQPVREFLEDMEGKYELIGVDDNEIN